MVGGHAAAATRRTGGAAGTARAVWARRRARWTQALERGFAPIKSLLEHSMARESNEEMGLVWGATAADGHYMNTLCRAWADALENFHYLPVSMAGLDSPDAAVAAVVEKLLAEFPKARQADLYLSGPETYLTPAMTQLAAAGFTKSHLTAMAV